MHHLGEQLRRVSPEKRLGSETQGAGGGFAPVFVLP
jgi:hypothetical protein